MNSLPIYLDHHATTPVDPRVLDAMLPWFSTHFGNPASVNHVYGTEAKAAVEAARAQVARLLNADPTEIVFTSGATEANNLALKGVLTACGTESHLVVNVGEHRAVLDPADRLKRGGHHVTRVPIDREGRVSPDEIAHEIKSHTALVSVMLANNEVGTIHDLQPIGELCRARNVFLHTDAVQAIGSLPVDLKSLPVDLLSLTAHKIYGPKGIGSLFVRRDRERIALTPQIDGGGHERHLRSGTLPVPLIVGFGEACEIVCENRQAETERIRTLRDRLWNQLQVALDGIHLNGPSADRLAGNLNVSFENVDGEALMMSLTKIAVSSGSACTSADPAPSHVLTAMGVSDALTRASLRFGVGRFTTEAEIDLAAEHVIEVVKKLRG